MKNEILKQTKTLTIKTRSFEFMGNEYKYENLLSTGNSKLVGRFLIFNIPAIETCPHSTAMCRKSCYAMKAQRQYKQVNNQRSRNLLLTMDADFHVLMVTAIAYFMSKPSYKNAKDVYFRIHESGDFYSQEYADTWQDIAWTVFGAFPTIKFGAYTKSIGFMPMESYLPSNIKITYSVWDDTNTSHIKEAYEKQYPTFTAYKREKLDDMLEFSNIYECVGDCSKCKACYNRNFRQNIAIEIH